MKRFVLICALTQYYCIEILALNHKPSQTQIFLSRLLKQDKFKYCKIMFLGHEGHPESSETLEYITSSSELSSYNLVFPLPSANKLVGTTPVKFIPSIRNHFKRSGQCFVIIIVVKDPLPEFMTHIFHMITPVYIPKTRKDEDYFVFLTQPEDSKAILMMNELPARVKFKLAISESESKELTIRSVCFFCKEGSPTFVDFPEYGDVEYFPDFITNLNGKTLRVSVPSYTSRMEVDHKNLGKNNAKRGLWKNLFEEFLGVKFNFTYRVFWSMGNGNIKPGGTGLQSANGSWTGIVGDLYYGNAELGILAAATPRRIYYMENSDTFFDLTYLTFVTAEGTRIYSPMALLYPFGNLMWLLIGLSIILSFGFFKLLLKSNDFIGLNEGTQWSWSRQVQFVIATFLEQDFVMPSFTPLRSYVSLWLFFTLIITSVYRSKLVSLMAFPIIQEVPKSFKDLAYSDYAVGFMKHGDSALNTLKASTDPVYVKLLSEMEIITGSNGGFECLEQVVKSKSACIAYQFALKHLQAQNLSDGDIRTLEFSTDSTYNVWLGLNYEGRSIYKKNFDKWLRLTRPMHFAEIWERTDYYDNVRRAKIKWWKETNQTDKLKVYESESSILMLKQIVGVFWLLVFGIVLGLCSFICEICKLKACWSRMNCIIPQ